MTDDAKAAAAASIKTSNRRRKKVDDPVDAAIENVSAVALADLGPLPLETPPSLITEAATSRGRVLEFESLNLADASSTRRMFVIPRGNVNENLPQSERAYGWRERLGRCSTMCDSHQVYAMTEPTLRRFLTAINKVVRSRTGTSMEHVEHVMLGARSKLPPELHNAVQVADFPDFQIDDQSGRSAGYAAIAAAILGPFLQRKIIFTNTREIHDRGGFQIFIANRRILGHGYTTVRSIFDISDKTANYTTIPVWPATVLTMAPEQANMLPIEDEGRTIAELHPNGVVILAELADDFLGMRIFHAICDHIVSIISSPAEYEAIRAARLIRYRNQQREFVVACASTAMGYFDRKGGHNDSRHQTTVSRLKSAIEANERTLFDQRQQLFAITTLGNEERTRERIEGEFTKLVEGRVKMIDGSTVKFDSHGDLHMVTEPIIAYASTTDSYHLIGRVEIIASLPGNSSPHYHGRAGARLLHKPEPGEQQRNLPYALGGGAVCFGTIANAIDTLLTNFEIEAFATMAVTFLQRASSHLNGYTQVPKPTGDLVTTLTRDNRYANL